MQYTFRTSRRLVATSILGTLSLLGVGVFAYAYPGLENGPLILGLAVVFGLVAVFRWVLPALRLQLDIDGWNLRTRRLRIPWKDVLAVWIGPGQGGSPFLFVGTPSGIIPIAVGGLELEKVWAAIQACAPPSALEPDAPLRLRAVQEVLAADAELRDDTLQPLQAWVNPAYLLAAGVCFCMFAVLAGVMVWAGLLVNILLGLLCFGPLALSCLWVLVGLGYRLQLDSNGITLHSLTGRHHLDWHEIKRLRLGPNANEWVLEAGPRRRLVIAIPSYWAGSDRKAMLHLVELKLEQHQIEAVTDRWLAFKFVWTRGCKENQPQ